MSVDAYQNCPCGSGKKFKWCCQKVAKFVDKADQLLQDDQVAAASQAIDEGLAVEPTNLWLRTTKARLLLSTHDHDGAYPILDAILVDSPGYLPALMLRLEDHLVHGAAVQAVATFQEILEGPTVSDAPEPIGWMGVVGRMLIEVGQFFAAFRHTRFLLQFEPFRDEAAQNLMRLEASQDLAPWLKEEHGLRPAPTDAGAAADRWRRALEFAHAGRWRAAAQDFEAIATEQPSNAAAHFNLGICRGWLAQGEPAAAALERYAELETDDDAAAHALALAMCLSPRESEQMVEVIRVRYAIRDHSRLIQRLKDHLRFQVHVLDARPEETQDDVKDEFLLLDKDRLQDAESMTLENAPQVVGSVRTRASYLELELADPADDDPRLGLVLQAAADSIDPNGEREVIGTESVSAYRLRRLWGVPNDTRPDVLFRIRRMANEHTFLHVWPDTPHGWLRNKTPREAAGVAELKRHLRASMLLDEFTFEAGQFGFDLGELRRQFVLDAEPALEGDAVDVGHLPLARLSRVRPATLSNPQLKVFFLRALHYALPRATLDAAAAVVSRAKEFDEPTVVVAFRSLIEFARRRVDRAAANEWLATARAFDADAGRQSSRPAWDIAEWLVSFELDGPEDSTPRLVELLGKVRGNEEGSQEVSALLLRLGLTRLAPHPSDPRKAILDARPLEYLISRFGARRSSALDLTPVGGGDAGKIWTPDSDIRSGGSPIVLPGQGPAPAQRSKLVIPGA